MFPRRARFHSIIPKEFDFDSGKRFGQGSRCPFVTEELMKDGEDLITTWVPNTELPHRCRETCDFSFAEAPEVVVRHTSARIQMGRTFFGTFLVKQDVAFSGSNGALLCVNATVTTSTSAN